MDAPSFADDQDQAPDDSLWRRYEASARELLAALDPCPGSLKG